MSGVHGRFLSAPAFYMNYTTGSNMRTTGPEKRVIYGPIFDMMRLRKKTNALLYQKGSSVVMK